MSADDVAAFFAVSLVFALGWLLGSRRKRVERVETVTIGWTEQLPKHWAKKGGEQ